MTYISKPITSENYNKAKGTYFSLEHNVGIGLTTNLTDRFYATSELGFGLYIGSLMKPSTPDRFTCESTGTNGTGGIIKIGIGYFF
jgi:hypothetical protein